jgi:hypothetical protein
MRFVVLCAGACVAASTALADEPALPAWIKRCRLMLNRANDALIVKDRYFPRGQIKITLGATYTDRVDCRLRARDVIEFDASVPTSKSTFSVQASFGPGNQPNASPDWTDGHRWAQSSSLFSSLPSEQVPIHAFKKAAWREGSVSTPAPDEAADTGLFVETFERAIDACFAAMPSDYQPPPPSYDPICLSRCEHQPRPAADYKDWLARCHERSAHALKWFATWMNACVAAERAARRIEGMCEYRDSFGPVDEDTFDTLTVILALGPDATPILLRLATAQRPVARMAAATGLGRITSAEGKRALLKLSADNETAITFIHSDDGHTETVRSFAEAALWQGH